MDAMNLFLIKMVIKNAYLIIIKYSMENQIIWMKTKNSRNVQIVLENECQILEKLIAYNEKYKIVIWIQMKNDKNVMKQLKDANNSGIMRIKN